MQMKASISSARPVRCAKLSRDPGIPPTSEAVKKTDARLAIYVTMGCALNWVGQEKITPDKTRKVGKARKGAQHGR